MTESGDGTRKVRRRRRAESSGQRREKTPRTFTFVSVLFRRGFLAAGLATRRVILFRLIRWRRWISCHAFRSIPKIENVDQFGFVEFKRFESERQNFSYRRKSRKRSFT